MTGTTRPTVCLHPYIYHTHYTRIKLRKSLLSIYVYSYQFHVGEVNYVIFFSKKVPISTIFTFETHKFPTHLLKALEERFIFVTVWPVVKLTSL